MAKSLTARDQEWRLLSPPARQNAPPFPVGAVMTSDDIDGVLTALSQVLGDTDHADKATWVLQQRSELRRVELTTDERSKLLERLHEGVLSAGGLLDVWVEPTAASGLSPQQARSRLAGLAYRLYALTDPRRTLAVP